MSQCLVSQCLVSQRETYSEPVVTQRVAELHLLNTFMRFIFRQLTYKRGEDHKINRRRPALHFLERHRVPKPLNGERRMHPPRKVQLLPWSIFTLECFTLKCFTLEYFYPEVFLQLYCKESSLVVLFTTQERGAQVCMQLCVCVCDSEYK